MKKLSLTLLLFVFIGHCITYAQIATTTLSSTPSSTNMSFTNSSNPNHEPYTIQTEVEGLECRHIPTNKYMYFQVTNDAISPSDNDLLVSITYFDEGSSNFSFQYNATTADYAQINFPKNATNTWVTATLTITDASFRKAQNNASDFRIFGENYIREISIEKGTQTPSETPTPTTSASAYSEFMGKSVCGYQLWFETGDASTGWRHWSSSSEPSIGNFTFELYPNVKDYDSTTLSPSGFDRLGNGSSALLFNSTDSDIINTHFSWMEDANIGGAAIQRFVPDIPSVVIATEQDKLTRIKNAAEATNRIFYIEYDISGGEADWADRIKFDWVFNIEQNNELTSSPSYATVGQKPVVQIWGAGFTDRPGTAAETIDLIQFFKNRGCYVLGGVPTYWRTESNDSKPEFLSAYENYDMISPWSVGRFEDNAGADNFKNNLLEPDQAHCDSKGIEYMAVLWPGFAWSQWHVGAGAPNQIPRNAGAFLWEQARNVREAGISQIFFAMFDEYDEGTALMKAATDWSMLPTDQYFLTLSADGIWTSSDFYLRLASSANAMVNGQIANSAEIPIPYSLGPVYYRNSFEHRYTACVTPVHDDYYPLDPCFHKDKQGALRNVSSPLCTMERNETESHTGDYLVHASGEPNSSASSFNYYTIAETKIQVTPDMVFSFWKKTVNALGRYTSMDLKFSSGKVLRDLNAYTGNDGLSMHPGTGRGTVGGDWEKFSCHIGKGELLNDTITEIIVAYDHPSANGNYEAYFDDIIIDDTTDIDSQIITHINHSYNGSNNLQVFPNPTTDNLNLSITEGLYNKVSILSITGDILFERNIEPQEANIPLSVSDFPRGIYLLKAQSETDATVLRITKQ